MVNKFLSKEILSKKIRFNLISLTFIIFVTVFILCFFINHTRYSLDDIDSEMISNYNKDNCTYDYIKNGQNIIDIISKKSSLDSFGISVYPIKYLKQNTSITLCNMRYFTEILSSYIVDGYKGIEMNKDVILGLELANNLNLKSGDYLNINSEDYIIRSLIETNNKELDNSIIMCTQLKQFNKILIYFMDEFAEEQYYDTVISLFNNQVVKNTYCKEIFRGNDKIIKDTKIIIVLGFVFVAILFILIIEYYIKGNERKVAIFISLGYKENTIKRLYIILFTKIGLCSLCITNLVGLLLLYILESSNFINIISKISILNIIIVILLQLLLLVLFVLTINITLQYNINTKSLRKFFN